MTEKIEKNSQVKASEISITEASALEKDKSTVIEISLNKIELVRLIRLLHDSGNYDAQGNLEDYTNRYIKERLHNFEQAV